MIANRLQFKSFVYFTLKIIYYGNDDITVAVLK